MTDLHTRAAAAWAARRQDSEVAAHALADDRAIALAALVAERLGLAPKAVRALPSPFVAVATVEGLRFVAGPAGAIALLGRCSSCGRTVASAPIGDLADLGKQLAGFTPAASHDCLPELLADLAQALLADLAQALLAVLRRAEDAPPDEEEFADDELPF
jgi:hypothetical protein